MSERISTDNFLRLVEVNVMGRMSDVDFRRFVRNALPQVRYKRLDEIGKSSAKRLTSPGIKSTLVSNGQS